MVKTRQVRRALVTAGAVMVAALVSGCRVETHKDGDAKNVRIATPFGGMSVKTNDQDAPSNLGVDVYPGAVMEKKHQGDDGGADVNMSFGSFHLGVKAVSYTTPDSEEKVAAFYRKALARYGAVIQCRDKSAVGSPVRTQDGLTCDDNDKHSVRMNGSVNGTSTSGDFELKAGSRQHQHIVSVESRNGGTKFGLVMLDLPGNLSVREDEDKQ